MIGLVTHHWGDDYFDLQTQALARVAQADPIACVVIVDNDSDGSLAARPLPPGLEGITFWFECAELVSWTVAMNAGLDRALQEAEVEYTFLVDGDCLPMPGAAPAMIAWLKANPDVAMVGGDYWFGEIPPDTPERVRPTPSVHEVVSVQQAGIAPTWMGVAHRELWREVRFEESGPLGQPGWGLEQNDLGCQIRAAGKRMAMIQQVRPTAGAAPQRFRYVHLGPRASREKLTKRGIDWARTRKARYDQVMEKWGPLRPGGHPFDWEREDDYVGEGRYSLRGCRETADGTIRIAPAIYDRYVADPELDPELTE